MCWESKLHNYIVCDFGTSSKHSRLHTSGWPIVSNNRFQQVNEKSLPFDLILSIPVSTFFSPTKFPHAWKAGHFLSLGCDFYCSFPWKGSFTTMIFTLPLASQICCNGPKKMEFDNGCNNDITIKKTIVCVYFQPKTFVAVGWVTITTKLFLAPGGNKWKPTTISFFHVTKSS